MVVLNISAAHDSEQTFYDERLDRMVPCAEICTPPNRYEEVCVSKCQGNVTFFRSFSVPNQQQHEHANHPSNMIRTYQYRVQ